MAILNFRSPNDPGIPRNVRDSINNLVGLRLPDWISSPGMGSSSSPLNDPEWVASWAPDNRLGPGTATRSGSSIWDKIAQAGRKRSLGSIGGGVSAVGGGGGNTTEDILAQLMALQDPSRYGIDQGALEAQARAAAAAQYDPQINNLRRQMSSAESRGNQNREILGTMFNQLSDSIQADVPVTQQRYADTKQQTQQLADQTKQGIDQVYDQTLAEQEAMWKRLNIEAAAPDVAPEQQRDRDFFTNLTSQANQTTQNALSQEESGAVNYSTMGAQSARREGSQRQADLMSQLFDLLNEYQAKIGDFEGAKNNAYLSGLGQLQQQAQENATSQSQRDFENYISAINLRRGLQGDQLEQMKVMSGLNKPAGAVKSIADVGARAQAFGLPPSNAQRLQSVFNSAVMDDVISGGLDPNTGSNLTPEAKAARIMQAGQQQGLSPQELNALQAIALEYFGRG